MTFTHRPFDREKDVEIFTKMLRDRSDNTPVDFTFFPPTGVVVLHEEIPVCIGFMIKCDNNTVINSDLLSDPNAEKEVRNQAVIYLREVLHAEAKKAGAGCIIATTTNEKLYRRLLEQGYFELNKNLYQLGRAVWP